MIELPFHNLDDDEFMLALSETNHKSYLEIDLLNEFSFNPFSLSHTVTDIDDLDPDRDFYGQHTNQACRYYLENDFTSKYTQFKDGNYFSLIHFNARSLSKNFDYISNYLSLLNNGFL